jgi:hypothetical protein
MNRTPPRVHDFMLPSEHGNTNNFDEEKNPKKKVKAAR